MIERSALPIKHPRNVIEFGVFRTVIDTAAHREIEIAGGYDQIP